MGRKRITQRFPWLLPLRKFQKKKCFYFSMSVDCNQYATEQIQKQLPYHVFSAKDPLYNTQTGFDMKYQENKVFNLKLAAGKLHHLVIDPGEVFSFWWALRNADKKVRYREGLSVVDGTLTTVYGGGMCQLSNLLLWVFLHSPLTVLERSGHRQREFPSPPGSLPPGVDATVSEGWLDLKICNETKQRYQLILRFTEQEMEIGLYSDKEDGCRYVPVVEAPRYYNVHGKIMEMVAVRQQKRDGLSGDLLQETPLYENKCEIGYPLPESVKIEEERR